MVWASLSSMSADWRTWVLALQIAERVTLHWRIKPNPIRIRGGLLRVVIVLSGLANTVPFACMTGFAIPGLKSRLRFGRVAAGGWFEVELLPFHILVHRFDSHHQ
ncbi:hypothetical protein Q31b_27950 [Novipirellula aureliae]|uniref:Uncharacterized protein n=1 Tax=Novipirellula aureliae TaxID=2527966 RepID=A0A5C6E130_9BACT|nr:hypothetical protein Q31b_27950 [Novipirellula aureliae]